MKPYIIREFIEDDLDQIVTLWSATGVARPWNDPVRDIQYCMNGPSSTLLVLADGDHIKGTAMVGTDGHRGWVYYVAVEKVWQGSGCGTDLMEAAEKWLSLRGIWKVNLMVRADNAPARGFYESIGYRDTDTRCFQKNIQPQTDTAQ